jgi:hypothetical protein
MRFARMWNKRSPGLPDTLAFKQARTENDDATCRLHGFVVDTADYAQCRQTIVNQRLPTAEPTPGRD